jgi:DNA-binding transcriptional regulator YdaS (Cro superfamily)
LKIQQVREKIVSKINADIIKKASKYIGSKQLLAAKIGVSYKTVLDWASGRSGITIVNALRIEKATDRHVTAKEILPDYPWDELK